MTTIQNKKMKRTRSARASELQLRNMIDFFNLHKGLAEGKFHVIHGREATQRKWKELAEALNSTKGARKTAAQWQVVWRDVKSRALAKARNLWKAKVSTDNNSDLTEFELRIIGVMGCEYVQGSMDHVDSIPEKEVLQDELIHSNTSVLQTPPQVINITNCNNAEKHNADEDANDFSQDNTGDRITTSTCSASYFSTKAPAKSKTSTATIIKTKKTSLAVADPKPSNTTRNIGTSTNSEECNRARLSQTLRSTRKHFKSIEQGKTDAMMILANAAKLQAEAAMTNALAMRKIAKGVQKLCDAAMLQAKSTAENTTLLTKLLEGFSYP